MSISENVGGMSRYLNNLRADEGYNLLKKNVAGTLSRIPMIGSDLVGTLLRTKNSIKQLLIPGMWFENMGITYLGPVDGHDIKGLIRIFSEAKKINRAVLIHVITKRARDTVRRRRIRRHFTELNHLILKRENRSGKRNIRAIQMYFPEKSAVWQR